MVGKLGVRVAEAEKGNCRSPTGDDDKRGGDPSQSLRPTKPMNGVNRMRTFVG
jgi:hypothetical protein